jgi:hypothetical protein
LEISTLRDENRTVKIEWETKYNELNRQYKQLTTERDELKARVVVLENDKRDTSTMPIIVD